MYNFKFFQEKQMDYRLGYNNQNTFVFNQHIQHNVFDYLFQINDNEPIFLGRSINNEDFTLTLRPHEGGNIVFTDNNNNTFKIFTRPVE